MSTVSFCRSFMPSASTERNVLWRGIRRARGSARVPARLSGGRVVATALGHDHLGGDWDARGATPDLLLDAGGLHDVLILKTKVQGFTPGSETKRAVTTVAGATKLKVLSQLYKPDGQVVLERSIDGNVRFFGGNLRATHNLAHHVAAAIKQSAL